MRSLTPCLIVAIAICSGCLTLRWSSESTTQNSVVAERPCRDGLIVVENQPDAPVRISILKTDCLNPYFPGAGFQVESKVTRPIRRYQVRILQSYDGVLDSDSTSSSEIKEPGGSLFSKDESSSEYMSWALKRGWFKDSEPKLTFTVWSVTYADGSVWNRAVPVAGSRL